MTELEKLAARVEAEGPSRELDESIFWRVFPRGGNDMPDDFPNVPTHNQVIIPRYTSSLDAAMTLVPEGWTRLMDNTDGKEIVELYPRGPVEDGRIVRACSSTPAAALCAAALRANQESRNEQG